ncbi:hypothetical protein WR25_20429 [Diploscapter pachys]|uniref:Uncharacterized protein n=1 Tax=Diploscapter pachys TaxID=2018661 RepID=A0A2A2KFG4_9BILA|nr:hypothetical protein WR25_20429 [Diploscapter pachys]
MHYHQVDVQAVQREMEAIDLASQRDELLNGLLSVPVAAERNWSVSEIQEELDNNCQGILGYVVRESLERMAKVVDQQNAGDSAYRPMAADYVRSAAFQAASDLVFKGREQPSGYTEPLLHAWRLRFKQQA